MLRSPADNQPLGQRAHEADWVSHGRRGTPEILSMPCKFLKPYQESLRLRSFKIISKPNTTKESAGDLATEEK